MSACCVPGTAVGAVGKIASFRKTEPLAHDMCTPESREGKDEWVGLTVCLVVNVGRRPQARTSTAGRLREDAFEDRERLACGVEAEALFSHFLFICAVKAISGSTLHCVVRDRQTRPCEVVFFPASLCAVWLPVVSRLFPVGWISLCWRLSNTFKY